MKAFAVGLAAAFVAGLVGLGPLLERPVHQPIQFNHRAHSELDCTSCHETAQSGEAAGLPSLDTCLTCHESAVTDSPEEEKIRTLAKEGRAVSWQRLFKQPAHVYYSHRRHVAVAKLECAQCHGAIGDSTTPPVRVQNLSMSGCISCHEQQKVEADCVDCHR